MDKRRILIVDDERLARNRIVRFLGARTEPYELRQAENGIEALEFIKAFRPELVILDICMPELSGFDVLYQVEKRDFTFIFQTAYDRFAVKAFEENACDYLLKPFSEERFHKAIDKAFTLRTQRGNLEGLERAALENVSFLSRIVVQDRTGLRSLDLAEVKYFISRDHYTHVGTATGEFICALSVAHLAERLPPSSFYRTHRHCIVRVDSVKAISKGASMKVSLSTGLTVPVSRSRQKEMLRQFERLH